MNKWLRKAMTCALALSMACGLTMAVNAEEGGKIVPFAGYLLPVQYGTGIIARGLLKRYDATYDARWEASGLSELLEEGETRNDFLIRYVLTHPAITAGVCGTRGTEHLMENIRAASRGPLSEEVYAEAKRRLNYVGCVAGDVNVGK